MNKSFVTWKFTILDWHKKLIFSKQVDSHMQHSGPAAYEVSAVNATCLECDAQATFSVAGRSVVLRCALHGSEVVDVSRFV